MSADVFFSIITPTYNRAGFIKDMIVNILQQEFRHFELIIVDDGSTDNTTEVVQSVTDKRIKYFKKENGERGAARNYGAEKASGQYLIFFDSDDVMYPQHLSRAAAYIQEQNFPEVTYNPYEIINKATGAKKTIWETPDRLKEKLAVNNFLACNSVIIRKEIFEQFKFVENRKLATAEDKELWLRIAARYPFHFNPRVTFAIIEHESRSLNTIMPEKIEERTHVLIKSLKADAVFLEAFGRLAGFIFGFEYVLAALCHAGSNKRKAWQYLCLAAKESPGVLKTKRFWAAFKNMLLSARA
ncbi:MAG: glycosyltransferase [Niabella sp.]